MPDARQPQRFAKRIAINERRTEELHPRDLSLFFSSVILTSLGEEGPGWEGGTFLLSHFLTSSLPGRAGVPNHLIT